jgi:predicted dehydrogenase
VINVGVIGAGRISDLHARAYADNDRARIVAVADPSEENRETRGERWGVAPQRRFATAEELIADDSVDMVEILVPHHLHLPLALAAMDAGKAVSLQKPMGLTVAEADQMVARAEETGVAFKVFENFVFYPPIQRARALIDDGAIGDVLAIRLKSSVGYSPEGWWVPPEALAWRFDMAKSGGGPQVFDDGHHKFATAWYLHGLPTTIHAYIGSSFDGALDSPSLVSWQYADGAVGSFEATFSPEMTLHGRYYGQDDRVEITGTKGVIWVTRGHGRQQDLAPVIVYRAGRTEHHDDMDADWGVSFERSGRHFVDVLVDGGDPVITGVQGRALLACELAALESARRGVRIDLPGGPPPAPTG